MPEEAVLAKGHMERIGQQGGVYADYPSAIRKCLAESAGEGKALRNLSEIEAVGFKVVVEPVTMENLRAGNGLGGGKSLVAVDELGAADGQMVAFTEGREAANPFWPDAVPVDAYCALIVDSINIHAKIVS